MAWHYGEVKVRWVESTVPAATRLNYTRTPERFRTKDLEGKVGAEVWKQDQATEWHAFVGWIVMNNPAIRSMREDSNDLFSNEIEAKAWCEEQIKLGHPLRRQT